MTYKAMELGVAAHLFGDWQESIIWSCLRVSWSKFGNAE